MKEYNIVEENKHWDRGVFIVFIVCVLLHGLIYTSLWFAHFKKTSTKIVTHEKNYKEKKSEIFICPKHVANISPSCVFCLESIESIRDSQ